MSADKARGFLLEQEGASKPWTARPYLKSTASGEFVSLAPDGKWVLVRSDQSGRRELYAQRFTGDGDADASAGRVPVSTNGGGLSWWSLDGKEIRYIDLDGQVMSVQVKTELTFAATEPKLLYTIKELKTRNPTFAPDGRLMVVLQGESERTTKSVGLVVNFIDDLRAKMAPAN